MKKITMFTSFNSYLLGMLNHYGLKYTLNSPTMGFITIDYHLAIHEFYKPYDVYFRVENGTIIAECPDDSVTLCDIRF